MTPSGAEGRREDPLTRVEAAQQRSSPPCSATSGPISAFYREYYTGHGLRFEGLAHIAVRDLPFVTKSTLMEHFDAAVTDRRLRKRELEQWFEGHPDVRAVFHPDFVSLMSSGTSRNPRNLRLRSGRLACHEQRRLQPVAWTGAPAGRKDTGGLLHLHVQTFPGAHDQPVHVAGPVRWHGALHPGPT